MPGIGISNAIPFNKGVSWSSYWATLISATVENAAPTHVVLTFPTAKTALGASDFTIAGFTVSSASWTGNVLTLVLSYPVTIYNGNLTITFAKTGGTATVTNNVADDGKTVGWYDAQELVTKDGSNHVTKWGTKLALGTDLDHVVGTPHWSADGILFDGIGDALYGHVAKKNQPVYWYFVMRMVTHTVGYFFDGDADNMAVVSQNPSPTIKAYAGTLSSANTDMAVGEWVILRVFFNGASSKLQVNDHAAVSGNFGANALGTQIMLAKKGNSAVYGNVQFKEFIVRNNADSAAIEASIYNYLKTKYAFFFDLTTNVFDESKMNNKVDL